MIKFSPTERKFVDALCDNSKEFAPKQYNVLLKAAIDYDWEFIEEILYEEVRRTLSVNVDWLYVLVREIEKVKEEVS